MTTKTRKELDNAEGFNWDLRIDDPKFDLLIEKLTSQLLKKSSIAIKVKKHSTINKHLSIIVLNLWNFYLKDKFKYVGFSRDKLFYSAYPKRYNKDKFSFKGVAVVDALTETKHIDFINGVYFPKIKARSRIRAKPKLIKFIIKEYGIELPNFQLARNKECILLRDDEKNEIEYKESKRTKEMRRGLVEYNNLLRRTHIDIPNFPTEGIERVDDNGDTIKLNNYHFESDNEKFVHRVFNNSSWKKGGRFYGAWWTQIKHKGEEWRKYIRINNKPTTEIDFKNLHIVFLYALKKIDYFKEVGTDAYELSKFGYKKGDKNLRKLLKEILLTAINANKGIRKDTAKVIQAINKVVNITKKEQYLWVKKNKVDIEKLINDFADHHKPIKKYFFSGKGVDLQYIDSLIAEKIINHFTELDIPVLCLHDSFIIQTQHSIGDGDKSLEFMLWVFFGEVVKKEIKHSVFPLLTFDEYQPINWAKINCFEKLKSVRVNKLKITPEYWKRVETHQKTNYVVNWYYCDE
jgi:hypothetical protein